MQKETEVKRALTGAEGCCASASGRSLNRRTLYIGLGIGSAAGMFFGWDWLVAIGAASVIIAIAPCLIMCAGMCAMQKCLTKKSAVPATADTAHVEAPITRTAAHHAAGPDAVAPETAVAKRAFDPAPETPASATRVRCVAEA